MITAYHEKFVVMKKVQKRANLYSSVDSKISEFLNLARTRLFDVCVCKCENFNLCFCSSEKKIPVQVQSFLIDQRSTRQMYLSLTINQSPSHEEHQFAEKNPEYISRSYHLRSVSTDQCKKTEVFTDAELQNVQLPARNYTPLNNTALTSLRYNISHAATAALATSVLMDYKVITKNNTSQVVDKNKVVREKARVANEIRRSSQDFSNLTGLYFDGRIDDTVEKSKVGNKIYTKIIREDHYSLLKEPGSEYIGHVSPSSGDAATISETIWNYFSTENRGELKELQVIGCDGILGKQYLLNILLTLIIFY